MEKASQFIHAWHENFLHHNTDFLDTILHDEVVFFSPVVFKGIHGKSMTKLYLTAAGESFNMEKFAYVREVHEGLHSVLEFETFIDDIAVNGVDIIEWDEKGKIITGLNCKNESLLFHSGTKIEGQNIVTSGGRVIAVTSVDKSLKKALGKSYNTISKIDFDGKTFRNDIGFDL